MCFVEEVILADDDNEKEYDGRMNFILFCCTVYVHDCDVRKDNNTFNISVLLC